MEGLAKDGERLDVKWERGFGENVRDSFWGEKQQRKEFGKWLKMKMTDERKQGWRDGI